MAQYRLAITSHLDIYQVTLRTRHKMATIVHTFSNVFSWMKFLVFCFKCHMLTTNWWLYVKGSSPEFYWSGRFWRSQPSHLILFSAFAASQHRPISHWGWDNMAAILHATRWSAFSWMKMLEFWLKFHWSLFLRFQLTITQHWFR